MFDSAFFDANFFDVATQPSPSPDPEPEHGPWIREGVIHTGHKPNH